MEGNKIKLRVLENDDAVNLDMALDMLAEIMKNNERGKQTENTMRIIR